MDAPRPPSAPGADGLRPAQEWLDLEEPLPLPPGLVELILASLPPARRRPLAFWQVAVRAAAALLVAFSAWAATAGPTPDLDLLRLPQATVPLSLAAGWDGSGLLFLAAGALVLGGGLYLARRLARLAPPRRSPLR
jgi:hypothetical protein